VSRVVVTPAELHGVGGDVAAVGMGLRSTEGELADANGVAGPSATAAALEMLAAEWSAGAERLADDVIAFGALTQAVGALFQRVDHGRDGPP